MDLGQSNRPDLAGNSPSVPVPVSQLRARHLTHLMKSSS
jgi:hypothetical protein